MDSPDLAKDAWGEDKRADSKRLLVALGTTDAALAARSRDLALGVAAAGVVWPAWLK